VVHVLGVPSSTISGPSQVIMNDTVNYSTIFGAFNTYDWNCNNAIIVSNSNNNFEILFPSVGAYQVSCTSTNICSTSTATKNINVFSNVGLAQNNHSSKVTLLNNISDGNFIILLSDNLATPYQVNVMQTNGAEINATKEIIENIKQYELNLSYLPVGIYFLRISSISSNQFFKIVKI